MTNMWMVRGEGGQLYDEFRERGVAAIGWAELAAQARPGMSRKQLTALYRNSHPQAKLGTAISGASQVWRFINEVEPGDRVVTYSPSNRTYMVGTITGPAQHHPEWNDDGMALARSVEWLEREIPRDNLGQPTKNSLGSTLTVFKVPEPAAGELQAQQEGARPVPAAGDDLIDSADAETKRLVPLKRMYWPA